MGTLYDLLGALPSDDAESLRTAFRKAAKATHPDTNPDNPDAAVRFRELVRAYDILNDAEQRATYDQLLAIALQPPATKSTRTYEVIGKYASNTMAATIIAAVLVGGYTLFGMFSKPPGAAEMLAARIAGSNDAVVAQPDATAQNETRAPREGEMTGHRNDRDHHCYRRMLPPAQSGASNLSRASNRTIWPFNIIRASRPPISIAASFCIVQTISTGPFADIARSQAYHGLKEEQERNCRVAAPTIDHRASAPARCGQCRSPRP